MIDTSARDVLIIGVGNEFRGDDGAGLLAVRAICAAAPKGVRTLELPGEGSELIEAWREEKCVFIIDASSSGAALGEVIRLDARSSALPQQFFSYSTHAFSLAEAVETSRNLNTLPEQLVIYAIEGRAFAQGASLSAIINSAVKNVVDSILDELPPHSSPGTPDASTK